MGSRGKLYHVNPSCQKWEEENHRKHMERRIATAKSTLPVAARAGSATRGGPGTARQGGSTARAPSGAPACFHEAGDEGAAASTCQELPPGFDVQRLDALIAKRLQEVLGEPLIQRIQHQLVQQRQQLQHQHQPGKAVHSGPKHKVPAPGSQRGSPGAATRRQAPASDRTAKPPRPRSRPAWDDDWAQQGHALPLCAGVFPMPAAPRNNSAHARGAKPQRATSADSHTRPGLSSSRQEDVRVLLMPGALVCAGGGHVCNHTPGASTLSRPSSSTRYAANPLSDSHIVAIATLNPLAPAASGAAHILTTAARGKAADSKIPAGGSVSSSSSPQRVAGPSTPTAIHALQISVRPTSSAYTEPGMTSLSRMSSARESSHPSPHAAAAPSVRNPLEPPARCFPPPQPSAPSIKASWQTTPQHTTPDKEETCLDHAVAAKPGQDEAGEQELPDTREEGDHYEDDFEPYEGSELGGTLGRASVALSTRGRLHGSAAQPQLASIHELDTLRASVAELNVLVQAKISSVLRASQLAHSNESSSANHHTIRASHTASSQPEHVLQTATATGFDEHGGVLAGTLGLFEGGLLGASSNLLGANPLGESDLAYLAALGAGQGLSAADQEFDATDLPRWADSQEGWYEETTIEPGVPTGTGNWGDRQPFPSQHHHQGSDDAQEQAQVTTDAASQPVTGTGRCAALLRLKQQQHQQQQGQGSPQASQQQPPCHAQQTSAPRASCTGKAESSSCGNMHKSLFPQAQLGDSVLLGTCPAVQCAEGDSADDVPAALAAAAAAATSLVLGADPDAPAPPRSCVSSPGMRGAAGDKGACGMHQRLSGGPMGGAEQAGMREGGTLAGQVVALWDSLRQLHALMNGPRGHELSPRRPLYAGGFTPPFASPAGTPTKSQAASHGLTHRPSAPAALTSRLSDTTHASPPCNNTVHQPPVDADHRDFTCSAASCTEPNQAQPRASPRMTSSPVLQGSPTDIPPSHSSSPMSLLCAKERPCACDSEQVDCMGYDMGGDSHLAGLFGCKPISPPAASQALELMPGDGGVDGEEVLVAGDTAWMAGLMDTLSRSLGGEELLQELLLAADEDASK